MFGNPETVALTPELSKSMRNKFGYYAVFKNRVTNGNVCDAVKILFSLIKGTEFYPHAISYLAQRANLAQKGQDKCGDEDLELMLK
jgi:hypothetical protein